MIRKFKIRIDGKEYEVEVEEIGNVETSQSAKVSVISDTPSTAVKEETSSPSSNNSGAEKEPAAQVVLTAEEKPSGGEYVVYAPMPGVIVQVDVTPGSRVKRGDRVAVLEAMKMESDIITESDGVVKEVLVKKGDSVNAKQPMVVIVP